jgi:hypothetical protein
MASDNTIPASMPGASASGSENKHGFMSSFPRKIRDEIYDLIISEEEELYRGAFFKMRSTVPHVRLISKKFQMEYDECCPVDNQLQIFKGLDQPCYASSRLVPPRADCTTHLRFYFVWCGGGSDSNQVLPNVYNFVDLWHYYGGQIEAYANALPHLEKHELIISCGSLACVLALQAPGAVDSALHGLMFNHPRVSLLRPVYDSEVKQKSTSESVEERVVEGPRLDALFEGRETMATWSWSGGWEVDEEVTEKCRQEEAKWLSSRRPKGEISS